MSVVQGVEEGIANQTCNKVHDSVRFNVATCRAAWERDGKGECSRGLRMAILRLF